MSTVLSPSPTPVAHDGQAALLRGARRAWRNAGVLASDRHSLESEPEAARSSGAWPDALRGWDSSAGSPSSASPSAPLC